MMLQLDINDIHVMYFLLYRYNNVIHGQDINTIDSCTCILEMRMKIFKDCKRFFKTEFTQF